MTETLFKQVQYDLGSLIKFIQLGEIGLPDIQRPFVWKNPKVRDLFDSMYRGYPVGYLLFWQNALTDDARPIGADSKQKPPRLLIVDGQQRLTSLYAVLKGIPVVREDYERERIEIAFNPLLQAFEVTDAAIRRDPSYMPSISVLWSDRTDLFDVVDEYLVKLAESRPLDEAERKSAKRAIARLHGLLSFPFTALELSAHIDEEQVSEVFVRINSKGQPLNQADFILTLMSVFWDDGRAELEQFSRAARSPGKSPSPYNHFVEPSPDQLLRVAVGLGFKRARLKYVYSILRGKDLETEEFSDELRKKQFNVLKEAQRRVLDVQHWHDFFKAVREAGYRGEKMISSVNAIVFAYILYLMGRTEYGVDEHILRRTIARWFFMSSLTARYSSSPESAMEFDLARFRQVGSAANFVSVLEHVCDSTLTSDFWTITLPNDLATAAARGPSLSGYLAALVLHDARVLFSKQKVGELLDPTVKGKRSAVERHHLFPKAYLKTIGIESLRDTNQIANYALVEWGDNADISDRAPAEYLPELGKRVSAAEMQKLYYWHALPDGWEQMEYPAFLRARRELMAGVIRDAYNLLSGRAEHEMARPAEVDLGELIRAGETPTTEFKSTLRVNLHTRESDPRMELGCLRTIAGFLNSSGGTLVIGVADDGSPVGIREDGFLSEDKMMLHFGNLIRDRIGNQFMMYIHPHFEDYQDARILTVRCMPARSPVFVKDNNIERFYLRAGNATAELSGSRAHEYIKQRFSI